MRNAILFLFLKLICPSNLLSQEDSSTGSVAWVHLDYGVQIPFADLKDRFGQNFGLGGGGGFLSNKGLFLSIDYTLLFGNKVREDVLSNLRTIEGGIIGRDQQFAEIFLRERGYQTSIQAGYFLGAKSSGQKSGLLLSGGLGWLQHKIRIIDEFDAVTQVRGLYNRGYDRLSTGFSLHQSIRYLYLSENKLINFLLQVDLSESFTRDRRGINYNNALTAETKRLDILTGIKLSWIIPIYSQQQTRYY